MPKKARAMPQPLYVEVLGDDGPESVEGTQSFVDDFTGEVVKVEQTSVGRVRRGASPLEWKAAQAQAKLKAQRELLEAVGIVPRSAPLPPKEPHLAYNQRKVRLGGEDMIMTNTKPVPPWRRM